MNNEIFNQHRSLYAKGKEFIRTVTSKQVTLELYAERLSICLACDHVEKKRNGYHYCNACECPKWKLSRLDDPLVPKLGWEATSCPMSYFGGIYKFTRVITTKELVSLNKMCKKLETVSLEHLFSTMKGYDMDKLISLLTADEIRHFVTVAKKAINANLVPLATETPNQPTRGIDWNNAKPTFPTTGFIRKADLDIVNQKMTEAIANERWNEGFMFAIQVMSFLRP